MKLAALQGVVNLSAIKNQLLSILYYVELSQCTPHNSHGMSLPSLFNLKSYAPQSCTDNWHSANGGEDDTECEWTAGQSAFLNKTLDALPSYLFTLYNGTIPPPNVLDRSIIDAKDPFEWRSPFVPHA